MKKNEFKKSIEKSWKFINQKKVLNTLVIVLLLTSIILGTYIRTQNLDLLKDQTTEEYIPLALDPFYFLRLAETIQEQGSLEGVDEMRYPSAQLRFGLEILPESVVYIHKFVSFFNSNLSLQYIDVLQPVIFFILSLISFFFLTFKLTKSKITALIASIFLIFIPSYLYRTMAGFSDHESIGMFGFFLALLIYTYSLDYLNKKKYYYAIIGGFLTGLATAFTLMAWGGVVKFLFLIIPVSFFAIYLLKLKKENFNKGFNYLIFYFVWNLSWFLFALMRGYSLETLINQYFLFSIGIINSFVLGFLIVDLIFMKYLDKIKIIKGKEKYRILYSISFIAVLGLLFIIITGNFSSTIGGVLEQIINPFAQGRTGVTVAENKQPFLTDWISQIGSVFFWVFFVGLLILGIEIGKKIKKQKIIFGLVWILLITGVLFSRISSASILNGTNFLSRAFYLLSIFVFVGYVIWLYFNKKLKIRKELVILFVWTLISLIATKSAIRLLFLVTPLTCIIAGYGIVKSIEYTKGKKDELTKVFVILLAILVVTGGLVGLKNFATNSYYQAQGTGPSAGAQWQNAMQWVRDNTDKGDIFVHWWDYGYWLQYLGERPTITDGGHPIGFWDHLIGRYILTTPNPNTALSFMKTHNVSYLLIDPTDLGKYAAYSSIASDDSNVDRLDSIPVLSLDESQTKETSEKLVRVYTGGYYTNEDLIYQGEKGQIFLPSQKTALIGVILESQTQKGTIDQPEAVFVYNNQQTRIPIRYLYYGEEMYDFGKGLNATIRVVPRVIFSNSGTSINKFGSIAYLSPKVSQGLFAKLYLMNDPFNEYPSLDLAHSEDDPLVKQLKMFNSDLNTDFVVYNGFRGPIKVWKVNYPEEIVANEEFLRTNGNYAEFDNLTFTK